MVTGFSQALKLLSVCKISHEKIISPRQQCIMLILNKRKRMGNVSTAMQRLWVLIKLSTSSLDAFEEKNRNVFQVN